MSQEQLDECEELDIECQLKRSKLAKKFAEADVAKANGLIEGLVNQTAIFLRPGRGEHQRQRKKAKLPRRQNVRRKPNLFLLPLPITGETRGSTRNRDRVPERGLQRASSSKLLYKLYYVQLRHL